MNIFRSFDEVVKNPDTVLTVGTFDGVHKGHQKILDRLKEISKNENLRAMAITINPHPQIVLQKSTKKPIFLLSTIHERVLLFEKFGIENVLIIPFSYEFSRTKPEEFVRDYLFEIVGMKKMLIGYDHMFGRNREGDMGLLARMSREVKIEVEQVDPFVESDKIISSTKIRNAIMDNRIEDANSMLGYDYFLSGEVVEGDKRGRKLGFPTANVRTPDTFKLMPAGGVYLVRSEIGGEIIYGMANIGYRPTFKMEDLPTLEVNFFDFDKDLYGEEINVEFLKYIREEVKFSGMDAIIHQLKKDEKICRKYAEKF